jgi:hypothetical protein
MRNSKAYVGFKAVNGVMFVVLGAAIVYQLLRTVGPRIEAIPGLILGAAMFALGVHRMLAILRARR